MIGCFSLLFCYLKGNVLYVLLYMFDEKCILCHCMTFIDTILFIIVKSTEILKTEIRLTYNCTCTYILNG